MPSVPLMALTVSTGIYLLRVGTGSFMIPNPLAQNRWIKVKDRLRECFIINRNGHTTKAEVPIWSACGSSPDRDTFPIPSSARPFEHLTRGV